MSASLALGLVAERDVPKALSVIFGGGSVAIVVATPLGALLGGVVGWRGVFIGTAMLSATALLALFLTLPVMRSTGGGAAVGVLATIRQPGMALGMVGVVLLFGGTQTFSTYVRPFLERIADMGTGEVSFALLLFGAASLAGTTAAAPLLRRGVREVLAGSAALGAASIAGLLVLGSSAIITLALVAAWGFAFGLIGVGWSTWITRAFPTSAESSGGLLVASIQGSMMLGAAIGGSLIDRIGPRRPAAAALCALGHV